VRSKNAFVRFSSLPLNVIAGLVPAIHEHKPRKLNPARAEPCPAPCVFMDGRDEPGHDDLFL
jgi:hypothetical protein